MTSKPSRPMRLAATPRTADILRRCYRGEIPQDVVERAVRMLATADGHLTPDGKIRNAREAAR